VTGREKWGIFNGSFLGKPSISYYQIHDGIMFNGENLDGNLRVFKN